MTMKKAEGAGSVPAGNILKLKSGGQERVFDIDNPKLPDWLDKRALRAGGYPYDDKMDWDDYGKTLEKLQIELVKLQAWMQKTGSRVLALVRGPRRCGQGRHHRCDSRIHEPSQCAHPWR